MPLCYLLPGFGASTLWTGPAIRFLNYSDVLLGRITGLRLDVDGVTPADGGWVLDINTSNSLASYYGMIPGYYDLLHQTLESGLKAAGYAIQVYPWDWRYHLQATGDKLANNIRGAVKADDPCTLVGHSAGGLVARLAWYSLSKTNQTNLIRRIITLGTPHLGALSTCRELSPHEHSTTTFQLWAGNFLLGIIPRFPIKNPIVFSNLSEIDVANLALSWPALYELMPFSTGRYADASAKPTAHWDPASYRAGLIFNLQHRDDARDKFGPLLQTPATLPPYEVMMTVAGTGQSTPYTITQATNLWSSASVNYTDSGDQTVPELSAIIPGYYAPLLNTTHPALPDAVCDSSMIIGWILDPIPESPASTTPLVLAPTVGGAAGLPWPPGATSTGSNRASIPNLTVWLDP